MCFAFAVCCGRAQAQVSGFGATSPQYALDVNGHINSSEGNLIGEYSVLTMPGGCCTRNITVVFTALLESTGEAQYNAAADIG
jgi:hypothetical protein